MRYKILLTRDLTREPHNRSNVSIFTLEHLPEVGDLVTIKDDLGTRTVELLKREFLVEFEPTGEMEGYVMPRNKLRQGGTRQECRPEKF